MVLLPTRFLICLSLHLLASVADGFSTTTTTSTAALVHKVSLKLHPPPKNRHCDIFVPLSSTSSTSSSSLKTSPTPSPLWTLKMSLQAAAESDDDINGANDRNLGLRHRLRQVTGFSWTAFRATLRAATGLSLSAIYASCVAVSGLWIRRLMSTVLSMFPAWFRYFLQPFLILYYAPLFILRGLTGPNRRQAKAKHLQVVESWNEARRYAE